MQFFTSWYEAFLSVMNTFVWWKDPIDILFITLVIFALIKFVRETRAEQLLKGILIFLFIFVVSVLLNLTMFTALLSNVIQYSAIILFIVFQPEIRRALEQIGQSKLSNTFSFSGQSDNSNLIAAEKKTIVDVADASIIFSRSHVGALMVFERKTKLSDIVNTGTILDAASSVAIIGNVFFNKAPLHDGAMIIRSSKIYAAGCILPLTKKNENIDINLGTRHRAAIGMSEESDAVVIIVSEETGNISMAYKGHLSKIEDREDLITTLEELLLGADLSTKTDIVDLIPIFSSKRKEKKNGK
ncbi:membrane protein [Clostridia bacterium]|nr:membrane protein [Clostridia bacterium]